MKVHLENVRKSFDGLPAVDQFTLRIESGEMLMLLGPSGCGKTTVLRLLAGFLQPESGQIYFDSQSMGGLPPEKRPTALVFQNYALWPHLSVFENVAYGLRVRHRPQAEILKRVEEALAQVRMTAYRDRKPAHLSGGQQQRVALARAFVVRPHLLLFDEPLCNLDQRLRVEMRAEIKRLQAESGITSLYVTHDQEEALALASRVAVMHQGRIQQLGSPEEVYHRPATPFVARFVGEINLYTPERPLAKLRPLSPHQSLGFRPEDVLLSTQPQGLPATVRQSTFLGNRYELLLHSDAGDQIKALSPEGYPPGTHLYCDIPLRKVLIYEQDRLI